ncbi:MAG: HsdR family type I site-specific deoxyribonuclease [Archaeoglobaceae archaeon]|nr:HsdR family type I site-specific deoxyribonuclease [Archaeoglobaceae archaeon]MDW8118786.1 HsdR family type I site-specific deoxyribonuclease [Archaeoglobaceae archaeon]
MNSEKRLVEDYIVEHLVKKGWSFFEASDLKRDNPREHLLTSDLINAIKRINRGFEFTESDINRILLELKKAPATMEGAKIVLRGLKHGIPIKLEKERIVKNVQLIDYEKIENNDFIVSRQVIFSGYGEIRADIILYVNGIPIVLIECKSPAKQYSTLEEAYEQVKRYERTVPELFKYVQFSIIAEWNARYFSNTTYGRDVPQERWRVEGIEDELDAIIEMLDKKVLLDLIRYFIFIREWKGELTRVIARWMQYQATNKMVERVIKNLKGEDERKNGLIWHWLGSGKTLTMIFTANKLWTLNVLENPTIFFIVDRMELEEQLRNEYEALETSLPTLGRIESIKELIENLRKGRRGTFLTLIHKFRPEEIKTLIEELEKIELEKGEETILSRRNIVAFIDEGHRTQYGLLAAAMRCALKNAFFFAFTGTPISKGGRDTYAYFAYPEKGEEYLHRYFIVESQRDGHTLPIVFTSRLLDRVGLKYNQEVSQEYQEFLESETFEDTEDRIDTTTYKKIIDFLVEHGALREIPEEYKSKVREQIARKMNKIKVFMEKPERIQLIAEDIAKHYIENLDGKFKAMVVTASRIACVRYKRAIDEFLRKFSVSKPERYTEIVMTYTQNDPEEIRAYQQILREKYGLNREISEINKEIITKFKDEEYPKIAIVTDMLITGFDHPLLQTIYLDKPLKGHLLLQTVARVNRPAKEKELGMVVDYVGILEDYEKALAFYEREDYKTISQSFQNIEKLIKEFENLLKEIEELIELKEYVNDVDELKTAKRLRFDRETLKRITNSLLIDEEKAKKFLSNYKRLRRLFEILGPSPEKIRYQERYTALTEIYYTYLHRKRDFEDVDGYVRKYFPKTLEIIQKSIDLGKIEELFPAIKLDEEYLKSLQEKYSDIAERVSNMVFDIRKFVYTEKSRSPFLETIGERVNRILQEIRDRRIKTEDAYNELKQVVTEINEIQARRKELSDRELSILIPIEKAVGKSQELIDSVKKLVIELEKEGLLFSGWNQKTESTKKVGLKIRSQIRKIPGLKFEDRDKIFNEIMENLKKVG